LFRSWIGYGRIIFLHAKARHDVRHVRIDVGIEDEKLAVLLELGMKRHSEETFLVLLVAIANLLRDVEKDLGFLVAGLEDMDDALLLSHENAVRSVASMGQQNRTELTHLA